MRRRAFLQAGLAATAAAATAAVPDPDAAVARARGLAGRWMLRDQDSILRLNSNENALGPSESARRAILDGLGESNRYTHPVVAELLPELAAHHGVREASIVLGNGSTEILRMAVAATVGPGGKVVVADPTFEHVERYAVPFGLGVAKVPLTPDFAHDLDGMRDAARGSAGTVLVYICNPNNPTGSLTPSGDVESWIREAPENVVFLVDEAYFEYVNHPDYRSALPLALERPNTMVARTFSKIYGLAGLRLGYGLAHPELARRIGAFTGFSNLNQMGLRSARACLEDGPWLQQSLAANESARSVTYRVLDELALERIPSHANFVMHRVPGDIQEYVRRMRTLDVWVGRPFPPMTGYNRLSFGLPEEMKRFGDRLRTARRNGWV